MIVTISRERADVKINADYRSVCFAATGLRLAAASLEKGNASGGIICAVKRECVAMPEHLTGEERRGIVLIKDKQKKYDSVVLIVITQSGPALQARFRTLSFLVWLYFTYYSISKLIKGTFRYGHEESPGLCTDTRPDARRPSSE